MRTHKLSGRDFDLIAASAAGPGTIAVLARAELSKHLLLLRTVMAVGADRFPSAYSAAGLDSGFQLLTDVQRTDPTTAAQVIGLPHFGAWAFRCLSGFHRDSDDRERAAELGRLNALAALAAIRSGLEARLRVPVRNGALALPTLGALHLPGPAWAELRHTPGVGTFALPPGRAGIRLPIGEGSGGNGRWSPVARLRNPPGSVPVEVLVDDVDPALGTTYRRGRPGGEEPDRRWRTHFAPAWRLLSRHHGERARALAAALHTVVPLAARPTGRTSGTAPSAFGAVAMSPPGDAASFAEALVHEFQHVVLGALNDMMPFTERDSGARYYAPWRPDARPVDGLLHGCYAYIGVTEFWRRVRAHVSARHRAHVEFARWRSAVERTLDALEEAEALNEAGVRLVRGMRASTEAWRSERVPRAAQRDADTLNADHRLTWLTSRPAEARPR
ncbi:HEXXH motif domain-containing protein [Allonocardiopsis opalescens]|uniref:HEXXH motif domain-containing protein n=1 Tax=Allonocardiopsis opalescens TaxID=1144618 RepID=UPI0014767DFD|nr:HEXXH motif domain-containing protein [Allonocardiopsis opalescens]